MALASAPPEGERKHVKPETRLGHFAGTAPPKKRRKTETKRPPKPKLTVEDRLHVVMSSSKRDFLVVELVRPEGQEGVLKDPDDKLQLAKTGAEHTVGTFLRTEKLEFSSLRHAKFSTMLLLHALLSEQLPPERYPDVKDAPLPASARDSAAAPASDGGAGAAAASDGAGAPAAEPVAESASRGGAEATAMEVVEVSPPVAEDVRPVESDAMDEDEGSGGGGGAAEITLDP